MDDQDLELKNVIRQLREDLQAAMEEGDGKAIKFKLESIELELKVAATKSKGIKGGIRFSVLGVGAEVSGGGKVENQHVQTIKLKMVPELVGGGTAKIAYETADRPPVPRRRGGSK